MRHKFLVLIGLLAASPALADPLQTPEQLALGQLAIDQCLLSAGETEPYQPQNCIGVVQRACDEAISAGGEAAHATCADNETAVWDTLLATTLADSAAKIGRDRFAALEAVQRDWSTWVDRKCGFLKDQAVSLGWGLMLSAQCRLDETARRALDLRAIADDPNYSAE